MTPFASELLGSAVFAFTGTAVMCNARLARTGAGAAGGLSWGAVSAGWGAALATALLVTRSGGAHLNPAATFALWQLDRVTGAEAASRMLGQGAGALVGMVLAWAAFIPHWARTADAVPADVLYRSPAVRAPLSNVVASAIGSAALAYVMLRLLAGAALADGPGADTADAGLPPSTATPFIVVHPFEGSLVAGIGLAALILGVGGTGAPLMPQLGICGRLAHAVLPIPGKVRTDWRDAWIAVAGPALGALAAAALWRATVA
jgi:glycerol uptake facilitator protein